MSGDIFDCHNWEILEASSEQRTSMQLNILRRTGQSQQQKIIWPNTSIVSRLRNPEQGKGKNTSKDQSWETQAEKTTGDRSFRATETMVRSFSFTVRMKGKTTRSYCLAQRNYMNIL